MYRLIKRGNSELWYGCEVLSNMKFIQFLAPDNGNMAVNVIR